MLYIQKYIAKELLMSFVTVEGKYKAAADSLLRDIK